MIEARLADPADFVGWRGKARTFAQRGVAPDEILWLVGEETGGLFGGEPLPSAAEPGEGAGQLTVPRAFLDLAAQVICHRDPERFSLLYRMLSRLQHEPRLLMVTTDADVHRAEAMARSVRRDVHKMTAFVRFREVADAEGREAYVAWFEPEHFILERASRFFVERFATMRWSILTPQGSLHWDLEKLHRGEAASRSDAPSDDVIEDYWRTYYANIFNPARLKIKAMKAEMPQKYWRNLPEAELIAPLIAGAVRRAATMIETMPTLPPERHLRQSERNQALAAAPATEFADLGQVAAAARDCQRCGLCHFATQTVFGAGPQDARVMFVGEQPGDREDLSGTPFVGPAGELFNRVMGEAGLDRRKAYVTNAVKHFKFEVRGKRRIHQSPGAGEISACRFWLDLERDFVKPELVVAMGGTALRALTGHTGSLASMRDRALTLEDGTPLLATVHPSYLLRLPDEAAKRREGARFLADLRRAGELVPSLQSAA
jgi:probable DNA metabolism protein